MPCVACEAIVGRETLLAVPGRFELICRNVTPCGSYLARSASSVALACCDASQALPCASTTTAFMSDR